MGKSPRALVLLVAAAVSLGACFDFDGAYQHYCDGGRCGSSSSDGGTVLPDGGSAGDGGGQTDAGSDGGTDAGSDAGSVDGGGGTDGGTDGGAGCASSLCYVDSYTVSDGGVMAFFAVWGSAPDDVWAGGFDGVFARHGPAGFSTTGVQTSRVVRAIHGLGPGYAWSAVDDFNKTYHWAGSAWTAVSHGLNEQMFGIFVRGVDDVLAVAGTSFARFDGSQWTVLNTATVPYGYYQGLWSAPTGEAWGVMSYGHIFRVDPGGALAQEVSPVATSLYAVHGSDRDNVWAVGEAGVVVRRESNGSWRQVPFPTDAVDLTGVWVSPGGEAWVVGKEGMIARSQAGDTWRLHPTVQPGASVDHFSVFGIGDELWVASAVRPTSGFSYRGGVLIRYRMGNP